jgi:ATP-dependent helicase/nuclease subunit B
VPIEDGDALVQRMLEQVERMAARFARPGTSYPALPWPSYIPAFNDYAHLERVAEWSTAGGGEE